MKNQEAELVANAIISLCSRVCIPKELLTDQGSNFMSELMREECRLLKIGMRTSPYHAMSNGLCEIFSGVLKKMLGAYARSQPAKWD
jgi:transposase InsO family protein